MKKLKAARELAMQAIYHCEMLSNWDLDQIEFFMDVWGKQSPQLTEDITDEGISYAKELCGLIVTHLAEIDKCIGESSTNWSVTRMAAVDRNILRVAVSELLYTKGVPTKVCIDQAIEIAKSFSSVESSQFVNGVLDQIASKQGLLEKAVS